RVQHPLPHYFYSLLLFLLIRPPPSSTLFPYTTLFRSGLLLFRAIGAEPYGVPTGSMAPTLLGNHRAVTCPRCGYPIDVGYRDDRSEEHTSELQSRGHLVCRLLLEKKKNI